jgi:hypothetical protein
LWTTVVVEQEIMLRPIAHDSVTAEIEHTHIGVVALDLGEPSIKAFPNGTMRRTLDFVARSVQV